MFAIRIIIKYTEKKTGRYIFPGVIAFVAVVIVVITCHISNAVLSDITLVDTIELTCDINLNENDEISIYKLTVAGYLSEKNEQAEEIPPFVFQNFELITNGTVESIENIVLLAHINGEAQAIKYATSYSILEKIDINKGDK